MRVTANRADDEAGELDVARATRELARRERGIPASGDRGVEEKHREHARDRQTRSRAAPDSPSEPCRKSSPCSATFRLASEPGLRRSFGSIPLRAIAPGRLVLRVPAIGHAIAVIDAERARRLLRERVAVSLAVRGTDERGDDLEAPVLDVDCFTPEIGEPQVDVELEQVDSGRASGRVSSHASSVRVRSDGPSAALLLVAANRERQRPVGACVAVDRQPPLVAARARAGAAWS